MRDKLPLSCPISVFPLSGAVLSRTPLLEISLRTLLLPVCCHLPSRSISVSPFMLAPVQVPPLSTLTFVSPLPALFPFQFPPLERVTFVLPSPDTSPCKDAPTRSITTSDADAASVLIPPETVPFLSLSFPPLSADAPFATSVFSVSIVPLSAVVLPPTLPPVISTVPPALAEASPFTAVPFAVIRPPSDARRPALPCFNSTVPPFLALTDSFTFVFSALTVPSSADTVPVTMPPVIDAVPSWDPIRSFTVAFLTMAWLFPSLAVTCPATLPPVRLILPPAAAVALPSVSAPWRETVPLSASTSPFSLPS